jgi:outer membrane lipoprotein LolB
MLKRTGMTHTLFTSLAPICLLTACTTPKPVVYESPPLQTPPNQHQSHNDKTTSPTSLSSWTLSGALAAKNTKTAWTASVNWQQNGLNHYLIRLFGPLGNGTVIIKKQGYLTTYQDGKHTVSSTNADDLLMKKTGVRLPVINLYYWVRGIPAPGNIEFKQYDASKQLIILKQAGYTINYTSYTKVNNLNLPNKIRLEGHGITIKWVIKHWSVS